MKNLQKYRKKFGKIFNLLSQNEKAENLLVGKGFYNANTYTYLHHYGTNW